MPIATFERNEAMIVEVDLNRDALLRLMEHPARAGHPAGRAPCGFKQNVISRLRIRSLTFAAPNRRRTEPRA